MLKRRGKLVWSIDSKQLGLESTTWPHFKRWAQKHLRSYALENYGIPPNWVRVKEGPFNLVFELPPGEVQRPTDGARPITEWRDDMSDYCGELIEAWCLNRDFGEI